MLLRLRVDVCSGCITRRGVRTGRYLTETLSASTVTLSMRQNLLSNSLQIIVYSN
jgi:hypothetical protein